MPALTHAGPLAVACAAWMHAPATGQPAVATYRRAPGNHASGYQAFAVGVLRIDRGRIAEMVAFHDATLFPTFGLPGTLPADEG